MSLQGTLNDTWNWVRGIFSPGDAYKDAASQLGPISEMYKQLAAQQFGQQMQGLDRALPALQQTRDVWSQLYHPGASGYAAPKNPLAR